MNHLAQLLVLTLAAATPLVFAALGELVTEKSGVLNLGVEGMMLVGAVTSFIVAATTKSPWLGVVAGMAAGAALSLVFGLLTLSLKANQVATGLALSLFGIGLSAFSDSTTSAWSSIRSYPSFCRDSATCRWSAGCCSATTRWSTCRWRCSRPSQWFLYRTRAGLIVRAVGESPRRRTPSAIRWHDPLPGRDVRRRLRRLGRRLPVAAHTPMWVEGMTAGRGWIALALVVFATWKPWRVLVGAYLFGGVTLAQFQAQGLGVHDPVAVPVHAAVPGHDRGPGHHFA